MQGSVLQLLLLDYGHVHCAEFFLERCVTFADVNGELH